MKIKREVIFILDLSFVNKILMIFLIERKLILLQRNN